VGAWGICTWVSTWVEISGGWEALFWGGGLPVDDVYRQPEAGASWKMGNGRERKMSTEIAIALKLYKYESNMQHNNGVRPKRTRRYDNSTI